MRRFISIATTGVPIFVTRKRVNDGFQTALTAPVWLVVLTYALTAANAVGWGIYGVVELVEKTL